MTTFFISYLWRTNKIHEWSCLLCWPLPMTTQVVQQQQPYRQKNNTLPLKRQCSACAPVIINAAYICTLMCVWSNDYLPRVHRILIEEEHVHDVLAFCIVFILLQVLLQVNYFYLPTTCCTKNCCQCYSHYSPFPLYLSCCCCTWTY